MLIPFILYYFRLKSHSGAGKGNRTPLLALGRPHNSHYTIPACALLERLQKAKKLRILRREDVFNI